MQTKLTQITISEYKPEVLISIPKDAAETFDFFKAEELIAYGREKASKALDNYEAENK